MENALLCPACGLTTSLPRHMLSNGWKNSELHCSTCVVHFPSRAEWRRVNVLDDRSVSIPLANVLAGTYLHELIHATSFQRIGRASKAAVGIGVHWKVLTPYAWCKEPVSAAACRWAAVLPGIILGVVPFIVSLIVTEAWLAAWGVFFTLAASGDFLVLWLIRDLERATWIIDHPSRCGCAIVQGEIEP